MDKKVTELCCNMDDMTGEELGYAMEKLLSEGALDVFATPVFMKKGRPGYLLTVICSQDDKDRIAEAIFRHTTTIGIRITEHERYVLERQIKTEDTCMGPVRKKVSSGYGVIRGKYEAEDIIHHAEDMDMSMYEVRERISGDASGHKADDQDDQIKMIR